MKRTAMKPLGKMGMCSWPGGRFALPINPMVSLLELLCRGSYRSEGVVDKMQWLRLKHKIRKGLVHEHMNSQERGIWKGKWTHNTKGPASPLIATGEH